MGVAEPPAMEREEADETQIDGGGGRRDIERGEVAGGGVNPTETTTTQINPPGDVHMSRMQRLSATNPLRLVIDSNLRVPTLSPSQPRATNSTPSQPRATTSAAAQTRDVVAPPAPQESITTLNSRSYTNKFSLFLFLLHLICSAGLVCFLLFKGIQGFLQAGPTKRKEERVLQYFLPQVEAASLLSILLAFSWQKAIRTWPNFMVRFIIWSTFFITLAAGILLICFQKPSTDGVGIVFIAFSIGTGLYACWVTPRIGFCCKILIKSLDPVSKFPDLNHPTYWMLAIGFLWMSLWIFAVIGSLNFYYPPLVIIALLLSLIWTIEVMRNVVNMTVSRVIALYYLRGIQSNTKFCFQRAVSKNLGSASLGSLFVPSIEALRIVARGLNLLEGEDEFMFSCAHCCLRVMQSIFRYGNGWAYVQIAAYGKGFVQASQDTWELFQNGKMESIVDSDMTSAICFLTGVCSGSMCVIVVAAWTRTIYQPFTATISLLAFIIGYLMTRIAMALPHACVSCYYVCYAENPENRLFDKTISDRLELIESGRDVVAPTPRVPRRFSTRT
ncbi:CTL-like protein DDB_G0274487 [Impatiens glandulifera]|uniref:CTL-like protein DDB_G0274487 n=1 Tax=Impatiens glandulifera TaxID=253017 RepID=UPI001FB12EA9|nr:CTL-like protein DDB_G0274487 [Impatiens glandulifera]